ncbi:peptide-methionine (R)-S-oxide reductase MsrB [Synoicihabitans lomoniglobus]|uniref:Peptide methionine sulfoxide reductase MsrB n=1 Tax=Synoicihabitans lomoniglobus TaxID=2909285 RepID=A0AAF0CQU6_9BACT|nr:peptide-methionine (R)-S-oxide reductase MsrB [Opitutaceae bacterium LMO-M01]WED66395.1 peptide-methionine (R)-S-oxide reductase MsrB [Opitutaceae bacterium LMO-M01]
MQRFAFLALLAAVAGLISGCSARADETAKIVPPAKDGMVETLDLTASQWRERLTPQEFHVLRQAGTERPFTSPLLEEKRAGTFVCAGCELPLFSSETKFKSGTGWPSFWQPIAEGHVEERRDVSLGMIRVEDLCARCGGHLGHQFNDGPRPTGIRYCINGAALKFVPAE